MISLQQTELSQFAPSGTTPVALHRRSETALSLYKNMVTTHRQNDHGTWGICGSWTLPSFSNIGVYTIEAYNCFMLLHEKDKEIEAYFLDLSAKLVGTVKISNSVGGVCADVDQKRKELLLFTKRGELKSYAVRLTTSFGRNGDTVSTFHVIYRIETKIPLALRSAPRQVVCQHVPETVLGLTANGCILCWETGSLELLWHIEESRFMVPPTTLYADRFGPNFGVHCKIEGEGGPGRLEFWCPPSTFIESNASTFERSCVPLKSHLLHMDVETIGGDFGTVFLLLQANRTVQFWLLKDRVLRQHSTLSLTGPTFGFSNAKFLARMGGVEELDDVVVSSVVESNPPDSPTSSAMRSETGLMTDSLLDMPSAPPPERAARSQGVVAISTIGSFSPSSGLPGCEVSYLAFSECDYITLAVHSPCVGDKKWIETAKVQRMLDDLRENLDEAEEHSGVLDDDRTPVLFSPERQKGGERSAGEGSVGNDDESDDLDSPSYGGYDESNNPVDAIPSQEGSVFYFAPTSMVSGIHSMVSTAQSRDSMLQFVYPTGLVVVSEPSSLSKAEPIIRRVSRGGLVAINKAGDGIPPKSSLDFRNVSTACRSGMILAVTQLKEGLIFDMAAPPETRPIRLEIEIRPQAAVTCLHFADIFISLTSEQMLKDGHKSCVEGSGVVGSHVLSMVGDSDGLINFAVCTRSSVLQQGTIRAHSSPIVAVLSTGDSMRPMWKVGTKNKSGKGPPQLVPTPCPGSAIVSLSKSGEIKVWQPLFSQSGNARSSHTQILSIYQLSWRIGGMGSIASPLGGIPSTVTSASMDPTCLSCYVGYSDGALVQWPVPGLTDRCGEKVQVVRSPVWFEKFHSGAITSTKSWIHLANTSLRSASINFKRNDTKGVKYVSVVGDPVCTADSEENSIAYTLADLKSIAESSTFVTSSLDKTIVLWRFQVSKSFETSEFTDDVCRRMYPNCKYLTLVRCQSFVMSSPPQLSVCYPVALAKQARGAWRISALVEGIVVTVAQGSKGYLFTPKEKTNIMFDTDPSIESPMSIRSTSVGPHLERDERHLVSMLEGMCVVCSTHKPQKASQCAARQGVSSHQFSWEAFADWQKESSLPEGNLVAPVVPEVTLSPTAIDMKAAVLSVETAEFKPEQTAVLEETVDMTDSPINKVDIGTTLEDSTFDTKNGLHEHDKKGRIAKASPKKYYAKDLLKSKSSDQTKTTGVVSLKAVTYNGVHMKVASSDLGKLEEVVPKSRTKKYVVQRKGPHFQIAEPPPSPTRPVTNECTLPSTRLPTAGGSSLYPSDVIPLEELVHIDKDSTLVLPELEIPPIQVNEEEPSSAHSTAYGSITDDLSDVSQHAMNDQSTGLYLESGVSMQMVSKEKLQEKMLIAVNSKPSTGTTTGRQSTGRPSTGKSNVANPYEAVIPPKPYMKQPYRGAYVSVPIKGEVKEKYDPLQPRYVTDSRLRESGRAAPEGVSVYRTPALLQGDEVTYLCDGGLEKVPTADMLTADKPYMKNPPNYFDRRSAPMYYRLTSRERVLSRKQSSMEWDYPSDMEDDYEYSDEDDSDEDSVMTTGGLSTESQIQKVEATLLSSEREMYAGMSEEEKLEFLLRKKAENKKLVEDSKKAFNELLGEKDESVNRHSADDTSLDSSEVEGTNDDGVAIGRVMKWKNLSDAQKSGVSADKISELIGGSTKRRGKFTLKAFTKFATLLNREVLELACPPEIMVELGDIDHRSVDVKIESTKAGTVYVVVMEGSEVPKADHFKDIETLKIRFEGVAQVVEKALHERSTIQFQIKGLRPRTMYRLYACAHHNQTADSSAVRMSDKAVENTQQRLRTEDDPPEILELEWGRMDGESRHDELQAARCDIAVQQSAKTDGVEVPTADMIEDWLNSLDDDAGSGSDQDEEAFTSRKTVTEFIQWWIDSDEVYGFSKARSDFLMAEAMFILNDGETVELCEDDGYLTFAQTEALAELVKEGDKNLLFESEEYMIFRSWLKGGRVISQRLQQAKDIKERARLAKLRAKLIKKEKKEMARRLREEEELRRQESKESERSDAEVGKDDPEFTQEDVSVASKSATGRISYISDDEEDEDDVEEEEEEEEDPRLLRIKERSERLQDRASSVEDAIKMISNLHMAFKHGESEGLSVKDLELKRGQLRIEAITVIMAMKKLTELCEEHMLLPRDLTEDLYQKVSGASTFIVVPEEKLKAELPPQSTLLTLVGQDKKPIRGWDRATDREKLLELQLACMMASIMQLAVEVGVCIPNVEDYKLLGGPMYQPQRKTRWDNFSKWYVGNELHENVMRAVPTVARIMFTEWEKKLAKASPLVKEMIDSKTAAAKKEAPVVKKPKALVKRATTTNLALSGSAVEEDDVVRLYEEEVNKPDGYHLRCDLLQQQVNILIKSRNFSVMRHLWAPALPGRLTSQFIFPRMGLITPKYSVPIKRFNPFPSYSNETYSVEEVLAWFNAVELRDDDEMMARGELEGQKHQAYLDWLAQEEERMEMGRRMMVDEDKRAKLLRIHTSSIEHTRELPLGKPRFKDFVFGNKLPGVYNHITDTPMYTDGSGLDNEDEVQDVVEAMAREAEIALQLAREAKKKLLEDRKRKEEEERRAQEKLERDIRIEENKDRLKRVREHLENLKLQRKIAAQEEREEAEGKARQEEFMAILRAEKVEFEAKKKAEEASRLKELQLMHKEDVATQILREKRRDFMQMEHEDIRGMLMREEDRRVAEAKAVRVAHLEKIYEPYIPFRFDRRKIRNPSMHVLDTEDEEYWLHHSPDAPAEEEYPVEDPVKQALRHAKVDWQLYVKKDSIIDDNDLVNTSRANSPAQGQAQASRAKSGKKTPAVKKKPPKVNTALLLQQSKESTPLWPRSENEEDAKAPLIWSGPSHSAEKQYGKLRKQPRAFTPMNSGEAAFVKTPDLSEPNEIVMVHSTVCDALSGAGVPRSLLKSISRGGWAKTESLGETDPPLVLPPLRSASAAQLTTAEERGRHASFAEPLIYRISADTLEVGSPSLGGASFDMVPPQRLSMSRTLSPIRANDKATTATDLQSTVIKVERPPPVENVLQHHELALASFDAMKSKRRKKGKDAADVVKIIQEERDALRAFVTSAAMTQDKYYLETCRPGLRSRDSISANKVILDYRNELLGHGTTGAETQVAQRSIDIYKDLMLPLTDESPKVFAPVESSDMTQFPLPVSPVQEHHTKEDEDSTSADRTHVQFSIGPDITDDNSVPSTAAVSIGFELKSAKVPVYKLHAYPPPFSRQPFGVKGKAMEVLADSPTKIAHNKASDRFGAEKKKHSKTSTLKSLQRDEFATLQRHTLETTSRSYDIGTDINFQDNKGL